MKKYNLIIGLSLILSYPVMADTTIPWTKAGCESVKGVWITAHSATDSGCDSNHCNGMSFCISPITMNWFSALIWCKSIGRNIVSFEHLCPGIPTGNGGVGTCTNIYQQSAMVWWAWTSLPLGIDRVLGVHLKDGRVEGDTRTDSIYSHAVCE